MIIAFDVGNTHTVVGVFEGAKLIKRWRLFSDRARTSDECQILLHILFNEHIGSPTKLKGAIIGSVVPPITQVFVETLEKDFGLMPVIVSSTLNLGIELKVDEPMAVGADRIANAVAACELFKRDVIVVDMGTATTFDIVTSNKEYLGGAIAPGLETASNRLFEKTALLPRIDIISVEKVIGKSTVSMMHSGIFFGTVEMIDGIVRRIKREWKEDSLVVATGGHSNIISEASETIDVVEMDLTLKGLKFIYDRVC